MFATIRFRLLASLLATAAFSLTAHAGPKPDSYWNVDDVKAGMKGEGRSVIKGTKIETFQAEVLGVLKNSSPGRDLILCKLSGMNLEKTGVIAGMSGSPVSIDGKLLGAVSYAWSYGKDPIAGVTPFSQMHGFVEAFERRDLAEEGKSRRLGLGAPVRVGGVDFDTVTVAAGYDNPAPTAADGLLLVPLSTPVAASNFTPRALGILRDRLKTQGLIPLQGGLATGKVAEEGKDVPLEAGGSLAVTLMRGDFDLSGIGTVTHIEGNRVYGWGHPFMSLGDCDLPLMTAHVHTIYPRVSLSFKMGSPLRTVGVINADVSTGIAGWLERKPDMMPIRMTVIREPAGTPQTFNVETVRQKTLLPTLVFTALTNSIDMEGDLPEEMTALVNARIEVEGHDPIVIHDTFSGSSYAGSRAPGSLYNPIASLVGMLTGNSIKPVRIKRIECETKILPGRTSAEIDSVEAESDVYAPGETFRANVYLRPYKGAIQRVPVRLKLPADLPEGSYSVTITDDASAVRADLRDNPTMNTPTEVDQLVKSLQMLTAAKRTSLAVRMAVPAGGVAMEGKALPNLPSSMVQILSQTRRSGAQSIGKAITERQPTPWVVLGSETIRFTVTKNKKTQNPN